MNLEHIEIVDVHVGNLILEYLKENRITQAELARKLQLDTSYLHRLLVRKSMETDRLVEICAALDHNFFPIFCNDVAAYEKGTAFGPVEVGANIEKRLKEIGMTQIEFASKLGVAQSEISRILRKSSFETDKLIVISHILGYNFFHDFYHELPSPQAMDPYTSTRLMERYEEIVIENDRLKREISLLKEENNKLKQELAELNK